MQSQHYPVIRDWQVCYSNLNLTLFFKQHFHWLWHFLALKLLFAISYYNFRIIFILKHSLLFTIIIIIISVFFSFRSFIYYLQFHISIISVIFSFRSSLYYLQFHIIISVFFSFQALINIYNFILLLLIQYSFHFVGIIIYIFILLLFLHLFISSSLYYL